MTDHLIQMLNKELGTHVARPAPEVLERFRHYDWPGNVRELINVLERVLYSIDGDTIQIHHLPIFLQTLKKKTPAAGASSLKRLKEDLEKEVLSQAMEKAHYHKQRAAQVLGIHRTALYKKIKKYDLPLHPAR